MLELRVRRETSAPPEAVLDTLREQSPKRRHDYWSNVTPKRFRLHESGHDFIEVTEATFLAGVFWERSRYEWSRSGQVVGTVLESNVFRPGSTFDLCASAKGGAPTEVQLIVRREFQPGPKGRIAATVNHLGRERLFGWYLGSVLKEVEQSSAG